MKSWMWIALAVVLALLMWRTDRSDRRAAKAEAAASVLEQRADSLRLAALWAETEAKKIDTVVVRLRATVAHVDSVSPPDTACLPNIAVRDTLIAAQAAEIDTLKSANTRWRLAYGALSAANDTLTTALRARTRVRLRGPSVGPAVWLYPGELRLGVSLQFFGIGK